MSKTRHLDAAINIFRGPTRRSNNTDMRAEYEAALEAQGWVLTDGAAAASEYHKPGTMKRMMVYPGDRMLISFDGITWKNLNPHARRNIILGAQ